MSTYYKCSKCYKDVVEVDDNIVCDDCECSLLDDYAKSLSERRTLKKQNKIMREALENCLYCCAMRDPDINPHKQAADKVQSIAHEALKKVGEV